MKKITPDFLQEIAEYCKLTDKQTEAFIAFYKSERSKEEIAQELKISTNALSKRLIRALKKIGYEGKKHEINQFKYLLFEKQKDTNISFLEYLRVIIKIQIAKEQKYKKLPLGGKGVIKLTELPEAIGTLSHLSGLYLSENRLTKLPKTIGNLSNLAELYLGENQLTKLPEAIGNLSNLAVLYLGDNQLTKLPKTIHKLSNLSKLYLSENQLTELPETISSLSNLSELYLSGNQLTELPETIGNLFKLSGLYIKSNRLTKLPETISNLNRLTRLDLSDNQLTELPETISDLINLSYLDVSNNPLETPPLEVANKGIEAIREYFRQLKEVGLDYIYEAKLLIVGEAGAGKTTLANKIQDANYQLPDESDSTSTEGIDVVKWKFKIDDEREFCINIWDFGGQEIYHATHQFFLTKRSLYTLVADSRKEDTNFYYWLNVVELLSENSPLLIVKNEKVDRKRDINEKALRGQFDNLKETLSGNLKTNRGLDVIVSNIKHYIQHLPHIGQALPKTWIKVRQALENDSRNHITLQEYLYICQENGFDLRKDKLQLSGYLHDLGVCLHFQDKEDS